MGEGGAATHAVAIDRETPAAAESTWWFSLESGTYTVHMMDAEGNESTSPITCDIKPIQPAPAER